jgi:hypothetical protein
MDVQQLYSNRFASPEIERKNKIWQVLCRNFFQKHIPSHSMVVDIAAGYCEFINNLEADTKIAFDLNPDAKLFANDSVQVINDTFFNMESHLQGKADVIFASNIFEHLDTKDQVLSAIRTAAQHLKSPCHGTRGGRLMILQPDIRYVGGAYWDFIDHKVALTGEALVEAGEMCGLKTVYRIRKFLPYSTKSGLPQHPLLVWLYLKLMPVSGFLLGQQTFLILEKYV